jgi:hypothetical protein
MIFTPPVSHGAVLADANSARTAAVFCALSDLWTPEPGEELAEPPLHNEPQAFLRGVLAQRQQIPAEVQNFEVQIELEPLTPDLDQQWVVVSYATPAGEHVQFTMMALRPMPSPFDGAQPALVLLEADYEVQLELGWAMKNALQMPGFRQMLQRESKRVAYVADENHLPHLALSLSEATKVCDHVVGPANRPPTPEELTNLRMLFVGRGLTLGANYARTAY